MGRAWASVTKMPSKELSKMAMRRGRGSSCSAEKGRGRIGGDRRDFVSWFHLEFRIANRGRGVKWNLGKRRGGRETSALGKKIWKIFLIF